MSEPYVTAATAMAIHNGGAVPGENHTVRAPPKTVIITSDTVTFKREALSKRGARGSHPDSPDLRGRLWEQPTFYSEM